MIGAVAFLTVVGSARTPDGRTLRWFPVVGALIGLVLGGVWWAGAEVFPPLLAAALVVTADLVVTGMLHVDGLADSGDALVAPMERSRRLAVLADPTVGAFGVTVVVVALLLRTAALGSRAVDVGLLVAVWAASRAAMAIVATTRTYARPDGLAAPFLGDRVAPVAGLVGLVAAGVLAGFTDGRAGVAAVLAVVVGATAVVALAERRLGGFTGDVLGAAGVVGETVALVVAAASW